jgi:hypothetical protein
VGSKQRSTDLSCDAVVVFDGPPFPNGTMFHFCPDGLTRYFNVLCSVLVIFIGFNKCRHHYLFLCVCPLSRPFGPCGIFPVWDLGWLVGWADRVHASCVPAPGMKLRRSFGISSLPLSLFVFGSVGMFFSFGVSWSFLVLCGVYIVFVLWRSFCHVCFSCSMLSSYFTLF